MERSRAALPDDQYLARVGEVAYSVSYLEWSILGDLPRLADRLPTTLALKHLEPKTTSGIASAVKSAASEVEDPQIKNYLVAVYKALFAVAAVRNDVLHARPATHPQQGQRLNRAETKNNTATGKRFWIDDGWFDEAIGTLNENLSAVTRARPPLPNFR